MLYLLDANVLIDAARDYYPLEMVPEFWDWLEHHGNLGNVKVPVEIYEEICEGKDALATWLRHPDIKASLTLSEEADANVVAHVVSAGYAPDLTDDEVMRLGCDPFIVAYGILDPSNRCVVTTEWSKPSRIRANRHLPDVCSTFSLRCCNTFALTRELGFSTAWRKP